MYDKFIIFTIIWVFTFFINPYKGNISHLDYVRCRAGILSWIDPLINVIILWWFSIRFAIYYLYFKNESAVDTIARKYLGSLTSIQNCLSTNSCISAQFITIEKGLCGILIFRLIFYVLVSAYYKFTHWYGRT
jgi:hypothetical protein